MLSGRATAIQGITVSAFGAAIVALEDGSHWTPRIVKSPIGAAAGGPRQVFAVEVERDERE